MSRRCLNMDMRSLRSESTHQVCWVYGDRGIPDGYRHMDGFGTNTFKMVNDEGVAHFVKFHFVSRQVSGVQRNHSCPTMQQ